ncbi:MAG: bifunctional nuclease family protein [Terrimicrobiaceae bacterium]
MSKDVVQVQIKALIPTNAGVAVFIGNEEKIFVIYVDPSVGSAINMFVNGAAKERPLTHDLMALVLAAVGARVDRVIVNDLKSGTYFGRLIITAENELQQRKIIELDSRPSDCLAMATQQKAPIFVSRDVWDEVEDMSDVLETMQQQSGRGSDEEEEEEDES